MATCLWIEPRCCLGRYQASISLFSCLPWQKTTACDSADVHKAQPSLILQWEQQQAKNSRGRLDRQHDALALLLCTAPAHPQPHGDAWSSLGCSCTIKASGIHSCRASGRSRRRKRLIFFSFFHNVTVFHNPENLSLLQNLKNPHMS